MNHTKLSWIFLFVACLSVGIWLVVRYSNNWENKAQKPVFYVENKTDRLFILLYCNSSDYFLYKGTPIGFQYDLLKIMCNSLGKEPFITLSKNPDDIKTNLHTSKYDIIAIDLDTRKKGKESLLFSTPHSTSYPVMIQRVDDDLSHRKFLYIPAHFPGRIVADSLPRSDHWELIKSDQMDVEDFFELLVESKIDYLVADYNTAITLLPFYPDLEIKHQLGPTYQRRWILNPANVKHNKEINDWLARYSKTDDYKKLCARYFSPKSKYLLKASVEKRTGRISSYDKIIKKYSQQRNIDWCFVASIIYQESRFHTDVVGVGGSLGIMQLMPETAERYGVDTNSNIEQHIYAGIKLISFLDRLFKDVTDQSERMFFVAASYNAGPGHIQDAQRLCRKFGGNPYVWRDVEYYLELKSEKEFYNDPVVKNGYYPGRHTSRYTQHVMERYQAYKITLPHQ